MHCTQFAYYNMEKGKMREVGKEKKTQIHLSKPMSKELLKFLANEVEKGNRLSNNFKSSSFVAPANTISKKFHGKCLSDHIDNHPRTMKIAQSIISQL